MVVVSVRDGVSLFIYLLFTAVFMCISVQWSHTQYKVKYLVLVHCFYSHLYSIVSIIHFYLSCNVFI